MLETAPWAALAVGDGVLDPDGTWHRVTRVEAGWIELDGATAFPVPGGTCWAWDGVAAGAVALLAQALGAVEIAPSEAPRAG